jgi:phospholipid/cholesterol/gamma-HCH transport system substrate-binding protein
MTPDESHEGGLSVREQIERYRTAFLSVVTMIVIAALVGGYILAHENLKLPGWVPVLGRSYYTLKAEFQTAQAVTPGQGQAVTIAGAKIGEVASVNLHNGVAIVTMKVVPKYALIYRNATLLLRPKTQLADITIEVSPGSPSSGRLPSGATIPLAQTAPDVNFDEFLAGLDGETRAYLQELLAGAGEGFKDNGKAFSATLKRFDPTARDAQLIAQQLEARHANIARSIHNFKVLIEAFGDKDTQLADLIQSSNAVFATFAQENQSVQSTLRLLPGALSKTEQGLGKIAKAFDVVGPTLKDLHPFASALAPAEEASRSSFKTTTPIFKNEIRPFAREILPTIDALEPSTKELAESFPKLASSFSVLNELFNEIAYNPGKNRGGFLFYLEWAAHNANSVVSTADAHGVLARSLLYLNCEVLPILSSVTKVNPTVNILVGLVNPPTRAECQSAGILGGAKAASERGRAKAPAGGLFSGLNAPALGRSAAAAPTGSKGTGTGALAKSSGAIAQAGSAGTQRGGA